MMSFIGQASWAKMVSLRGKLTAQACHPAKTVKSRLPTYLSMSIGSHGNKIFKHFNEEDLKLITVEPRA
jgi:hypothetical protein